MKRLFSLVTALLCALLLTLPARAAQGDLAIPDAPAENEVSTVDAASPGGSDPSPVSLSPEWLAQHDQVQGTGTVEDPEAYWNETGWPEDVSYAYQAGGMVDEDELYLFWEIGLVDGDAARKAELTALLSPTCLVTFYDCTYSYAQRQAVLEEILSQNDPNIEAAILGRNREYIYVDVADEVEKTYATQFRARYGTLVEVTDLVEDLTALGTEDASLGMGLPGQYLDQGDLPEGGIVLSAEPAAVSPLWLLTAFLLAGAVWFGLTALGRRAAALRTTAGTVATRGTRPSRAQVERAVRADVHTPDPHTLERIKDRLS